jgi:hypothetical protein
MTKTRKVVPLLVVAFADAAGAKYDRCRGPERSGLDGRYSGANRVERSKRQRYIADPHAMTPGTTIPLSWLQDPQQITGL